VNLLYSKYPVSVTDIWHISILTPAAFVLPMVDLFLCEINRLYYLYIWKVLDLGGGSMIL
jgi:hypothetical protein